MIETKLENDAIYFANLTIDELGDALQKRVNDFYQYVRINGVLDLWRNSYKQ